MCATLHLHNLKSLPPKSFYATRIRHDFSLALRKWFQRFTLVQPETFAYNIILHFTLNNLILTTFVQLDFKILHLHNLKSLQGYYCTLYLHNLTFTTFVQLDFSSTPVQHEIFVDDVIVHHTRTTWIWLHSYNLISRFYTSTTWNLFLFGKMTYFTLHSHTLIFITPQTFLSFSFLLCVYFFLHLRISYLYLCLN